MNQFITFARTHVRSLLLLTQLVNVTSCSLTPEERSDIADAHKEHISAGVKRDLTDAEKTCDCQKYKAALDLWLADGNASPNQKDAQGNTTLNRVMHCPAPMLVVAVAHGAKLIAGHAKALTTVLKNKEFDKLKIVGYAGNWDQNLYEALKNACMPATVFWTAATLSSN